MTGFVDPRFKPGDSVVYRQEVYTIKGIHRHNQGDIFYEVRETPAILPESELEPYVPERIIEVTLFADIIDIGDHVTVAGYRGEFEVIGVEDKYFYDADSEHEETTYIVQHIETKAVKIAVAEDVALVGANKAEENQQKKDDEINALLDEINDYRCLREMFGDADGAYRDAERAAYEKLRRVNGQ